MKIATLVLVSSLLATAASAAQTTQSTPAPESGNSNQAVATTGANAMQPVKGANSFTEGEARHRLEKQGFSQVADLKKDSDGVWRGRGMKDNASVGVWLDYKGNIGRQ